MNNFEQRRNSDSYASSEEHDRALVRRIGNRDRTALEELYRAYYRRLARFLSRLTSQHELVQEIVNDTFWAIWQHAGDFRGNSRVSTWIIGIAYRQALKALRHLGARTESIDAAKDLSGPTDEIEAINERELLDRALSTLPLEQRAVLELTYYLGHSCEEIAAIVDCPVNTVKTRMFHARRKLKLLLPVLGGARAE